MKADKKISIKNLIKVALFIVLTIFIYTKVAYVFQYKMKDDKIRQLYMEPKNSLDVVFVGSSHVYYSISPMKIWGEYGIASIDAASQSQTVPTSYYVVKEAIRVQHPKVIVMDVYYMTYNRYARSQGILHRATDSFAFTSPNRWEMIHDIVPNSEGKEDVWSYYFTLGLYHSRWKNLKQKDFHPQMVYKKGHVMSTKIKGRQMIYNDSSEKSPMPDMTLEYLKKIKDYCDKHDTELLLVGIPYTYLDGHEKSAEKQMKRLRWFEDYASENGYNYLNMFECMDEIGLDSEKDFCSPAHTNLVGGEKITSYLGDYLVSNYDLQDHKNEKKYSKWNEDYQLYINEKDRLMKKYNENLRNGEN